MSVERYKWNKKRVCLCKWALVSLEMVVNKPKLSTSPLQSETAHANITNAILDRSTPRNTSENLIPARTL